MTPQRWSRIKETFAAAREMREADRGAWLDAACGDDGELRAEVEHLLAKDDGPSLRRPAANLLESMAPEFAPGDRLAQYRVEAKLGEGGMGAVYRAFDTRLQRQVAVKVLSPEHFPGGDRKERLMREARAASALNHPNIVTVHETGSEGAVDFIVMEYVEGKPLAELIPRKGFAVGRALDYSVEIAGALAAAHTAGVIHRDLKPGNIMVTGEGRVKLLDFGLARRVQLTPEQTSSLTVEGEIAGTPAYMSPEQAEGRKADARSDVFSFGAVLYEMITGRRAFQGDSTLSTLTAVLRQEPPPMDPGIPHELARIVTRCLRKDPAHRFQHTDDVKVELEELKEEPNSGTPIAAVPARVKPRRWFWVACVAAVVVGVALAGRWRLLGRPQRPAIQAHAPQRLDIVLPSEAPLAPLGFMPQSSDRTALALSPDGSRLAYVAAVNSATRICIRNMGDGKTSALAGTEGGHTPFFSPDGQSLGFFAAGRLKKISFVDATVTELADAPNPFGAVWAPSGVIYFNRNEGGISEVADSGGPVSNVGPRQHFIPELLPRVPALLAADGRRGTEIIELRPRAESSPRVVVHGYGTRYSATGHLVFADVGGKLAAIGFDPERRAVFGNAVAFYDDLRTAPYGVAQFALGGDGTLIYAPGRSQLLASFVWVSRTGKRRSLGLPENTYGFANLSPDGTQLAFNLGTDIWIRDLERGTNHRFTSRSPRGETLRSTYPHWTPDGKHIVYMQRQDSVGRLVCAPLDGRSPPLALWTAAETGPEWLYPMSFSPDETVMSALGPSAGRGFDIYLLHSAGFCRSAENIEPELFLGEPFNEGFGQISPDGRWMLYTSDHTGHYDIYVTSYPKRGPVYQVTRDGGREPRWNPAGREILYLDGSRMYSVQVLPGEEFRTGEAKLLFEGPFPDAPGLGFDITRDGQRFLMLENPATFQSTTILTVVIRFSDELRRRIPRGAARNNGV